MSELERISVTVTPETAALLHSAVENGEFGSTEEVMRVALEEWGRRRLAKSGSAEELGRLWDDGIASGPSLDAEASFARIRNNLREKLAAEAR